MKKLLSIGLMVILAAALFSGCKKNKEDPPSLPPLGSMTIDFSNFASLKKSADLFSDQKGIENSNWEYAATVAGFWNIILTTTLAVPVSAFKLSIDQDPVYLDNKTWEWSYNVSVVGVTYNARLTGQIGASEVIWKMYISGDFPEFLWFEGTSKLDGTGGQWILYQSYESQVALLQIDWTKASSSIGTVKYTYVKNDAFKNSNIEYGLTSGDLDAYYNVYYFNGFKFSEVDIEWSTSNHNGRVRSADYLDGEWYSWNEQKINI